MGLRNSQYDTIMRKYNEIQFKNKHLHDTRIKEVYSKSPRFQEIDDEVAALSVSYAKKMIFGNSQSISGVQDEIAALSFERRQLLESFGYPSDFLEPVYDCPDCKDTGYNDNKKCHCFKKAIVELLYASSNLNEVLKTDNFNNFTFDYYSEDYVDSATGLTSLQSAKRAYTYVKDFIYNFDTSFENLFFYGSTGVGKTFFSNCIAGELMNKSHSVIYFTAFELFDILAKNTFEHSHEYEDTIQYIFDCDLLIIDDLGTELTNSFVSSQLFLCVNERILRKRSTIISTNLSIKDLVDIYSERTFSRISSNYQMIKLVGNDIRLMQKNKANGS